jgi:hypothetical protein
MGLQEVVRIAMASAIVKRVDNQGEQAPMEQCCCYLSHTCQKTMWVWPRIGGQPAPRTRFLDRAEASQPHARHRSTIAAPTNVPEPTRRLIHDMSTQGLRKPKLAGKNR